MNIPDEHMPAIMQALLYVRNSSRDIRQLNTPERHAEIMAGNFAAIGACQRPLPSETEQAPQPPQTGVVGNVASMRNAIIIAHSMATQHHIQSDEVMRQRIGEVLWKVIEADDVMRGVLGHGGPEAHRDILGGTGSLEDSNRPTTDGTGA